MPNSNNEKGGDTVTNLGLRCVRLIVGIAAGLFWFTAIIGLMYHILDAMVRGKAVNSAALAVFAGIVAVAFTAVAMHLRTREIATERNLSDEFESLKKNNF